MKNEEFVDPTLAPNLLDEDDSLPAVQEAPVPSLGTEANLVPMPLNPSVRTQMRKVESHIQRAEEGFDMYLEKKPEISVRLQKNMIELRKLQLELLKFNSELYSRGTGVDTSITTPGADAQQPNVSFSATNDEGVKLLGQILAAGKSSGEAPVVECTAIPTPTKPGPEGSS